MVHEANIKPALRVEESNLGRQWRFDQCVRLNRTKVVVHVKRLPNGLIQLAIDFNGDVCFLLELNRGQGEVLIRVTLKSQQTKRQGEPSQGSIHTETIGR